MLSNVLYAIAVICVILLVLALFGVVHMAWTTLLIVAIVCAVGAYFLSGTARRPF